MRLQSDPSWRARRCWISRFCTLRTCCFLRNNRSDGLVERFSLKRVPFANTEISQWDLFAGASISQTNISLRCNFADSVYSRARQLINAEEKPRALHNSAGFQRFARVVVDIVPVFVFAQFATEAWTFAIQIARYYRAMLFEPYPVMARGEPLIKNYSCIIHEVQACRVELLII